MIAPRLLACLTLQSLAACGGGHPGFPPLQPCDPAVVVPPPPDPAEPRPDPPAVTDAPRLLDQERVMRYIERVYPRSSSPP